MVELANALAICIAMMNDWNVQIDHWTVDLTCWNELFMNWSFKVKKFTVEDSWNVSLFKGMIALKIQNFDSADIFHVFFWKIKHLSAIYFAYFFIWIQRKDKIICCFFYGKVSCIRKIIVPRKVKDPVRIATCDFFGWIAWSGVRYDDFIKVIWWWL